MAAARGEGNPVAGGGPRPGAAPAIPARDAIPATGPVAPPKPGTGGRLTRLPAGPDAAGIAVAVGYGTGPYPGCAVMPLHADRFAPVCNAGWGSRPPPTSAGTRGSRSAGGGRTPTTRPGPGGSPSAACRSPRTPRLGFSDESHAIQAAVAGQGVALASLALVDGEIAAGRLRQPFGPSIPGFRHRLLTRAGAPSPPVAAVLDWLRAETDRAGPGA